MARQQGDYEYVALEWFARRVGDDFRFLAIYDEMYGEGWAEYIRAPCRDGIGGACIMRRLKDEPRMWTEGEIREIAKDVLCSAAAWGDMSGLAKEETNG